MPLDFPTSPVLNQTYSLGNKTWSWNGAGWQLVPNQVQGIQGAQGLANQGVQGLAGTSQGTQGSQGVQGLQGLSNQGTQGVQGPAGAGGGGASVGGSDKQVQYNDAGTLAGATDFFYHNASANVGIGSSVPPSKLTVFGNILVNGNSGIVTAKYLNGTPINTLSGTILAISYNMASP